MSCNKPTGREVAVSYDWRGGRRVRYFDGDCPGEVTVFRNFKELAGENPIVFDPLYPPKEEVCCSSQSNSSTGNRRSGLG